MALIITATSKFIEVSLDGITDFDPTIDLIGLGLVKNAPDGLRIKKITFQPSAINDEIVIRDGQNGPGLFRAIALGEYDILSDRYRDDAQIHRGVVMNPYINANETVITNVNLAYVIFEL